VSFNFAAETTMSVLEDANKEERLPCRARDMMLQIEIAPFEYGRNEATNASGTQRTISIILPLAAPPS
jgi:hypothetical protein